MAREVVIEIRCIGCLELTTPQTIDMDLFRLGIHLHANKECIQKADAKLILLEGILMNDFIVGPIKHQRSL